MHYNKACTSDIVIIVKTIFAEYPCLTVSVRDQNISLNYNAVRLVILVYGGLYHARMWKSLVSQHHSLRGMFGTIKQVLPLNVLCYQSVSM